MCSASALQGAPTIPASHLREYNLRAAPPRLKVVPASCPNPTLPPSSSRCSTLSRRPAKACDEDTSSSCLPQVSTDRSQNVWQWILESERQGKHKPHRQVSIRKLRSSVPPLAVLTALLIGLNPNSTQGLKKSSPLDSKILPARTNTPWGGGGICNGTHLRGHHPAHPFIQDPAMPPLPPPNTLAQLEEACRRLEEVSKPPKPK